MISESIYCPHCGAKMSPEQMICQTCRQSLDTSGESQDSMASISALLGGIFAIVPLFLAMPLTCSGRCYLPGNATTSGQLIGVNFILGVVVGHGVSRLSNSKLKRLAGAAIGGFFIGIQPFFTLFILPSLR